MVTDIIHWKTSEQDKATLEMESMEDGFLGKILVGDGAKDIPVGQVFYSSFVASLLFLNIRGCSLIIISRNDHLVSISGIMPFCAVCNNTDLVRWRQALKC